MHHELLRLIVPRVITGKESLRPYTDKETRGDDCASCRRCGFVLTRFVFEHICDAATMKKPACRQAGLCSGRCRIAASRSCE